MNLPKTLLTFFLVFMLVASTSASLIVASQDDYQRKVTNFLSNVLRLDIAKYTLIPPPVPPRPVPSDAAYPSMLGGQVKVQGVTLNYTSSSGNLEAHAFFLNGRMQALDINSPHTNNSQNNYYYSSSSPTDSINQACDILERYQRFVSQQYGINSSYLMPMQNALKAVNGESSINTTIENIQFEMAQDKTTSNLKFVCVENGVSMGNWQRVEMKFNNNSLVAFYDTWCIYHASASNAISSDEALKTALAAAQKYDIIMVNEDGANETVKTPDMSELPYDVTFANLPYRDNPNNLPSKIARDALTLYPLWQFHFYYKGTIAGETGVQVGVWGDTGEVAYCSGFGYYDSSNPTGGQSFSNLTLILAVAIVLALLAIGSSIVVLKRRKTAAKA